MKTASQRQKELAARQESRAKLSPIEQLQRLDWRLGKGVGAKKERERLRKLIVAPLFDTDRKGA